jgi:sn-glycerol 3-phosphate transport system ATP-binding protein
MNMLPARIAADAGSVELDGIRVAVKLAPEHAGREITLGIRPEHVVLDQGGGGEGFPCPIDFVEALGADTLAHGGLGNSRLPLTVRLPGSARVSAGERLSLVLPPQSLHLFDAETGARLRHENTR